MHDLHIVHGDLKGVSVPLKSNTYTSHLFVKANILINKERRACIADFGLTTVTGVAKYAAAGDSRVSLISNYSLMSFTAGGTYRWMSPELLDPERFGMPQSEDNRPTEQSDCYALGMVIYEVCVHANKSVFVNGQLVISQVLCGHRPYVEIWSDSLVIKKVMEGIRPEKPEEAACLGFSSELWEIVERCWLEDHSARPVYVVEDILSCLNDAAVLWYTRGV